MARARMSHDSLESKLARLKVPKLEPWWIPRAGFWEPDFAKDLADARARKRQK